jgi:hypothetical protein
MLDINRFVDETLDNSITKDVLAETPIDRNNPISFIEWLRFNSSLALTSEELFARYNSYLNNWFEAKNYTPTATQDAVKTYYLDFINEIVLNFTSVDERRFLKNIDYTNNRDLAIAVPFFAKKIKDICIYFSTLRDTAKTAVVEYNLKGSNSGLERLIYNEISKTLEAQDLTALIRTLNLSFSSIRNDTLVELEELYDNYSDYFDLGTLPASAYNASGLRETDFVLNLFNIDAELYLNFDRSIVNAITSYPFFLTEIGTNNFSVLPAIDPARLDLLKDRDFINLINNNTENNLKLNLLSELNKKYTGTDFYYVSTGSSLTNVTSGILFQAQSPFANYLNKLSPTVAFVPNEANLKTAKQQGLFFKPDRVGFLNFNNFNFTYNVNLTSLQTNTVYIFPDPNKFGNISGNTQQDQFSPLTFTEDNSFTQIDYSNCYKFGDVRSDPLLHTFRAYQAREQSIDFSNQGLSRYVDPQEFFEDLLKNKWANSDVYPLVPSIFFPIETRLETLLSINKTLVQYKSDVYGNDYGLYKLTDPYKNTSAILSTISIENQDKNCLILDGHTFYDLTSGFNFDYTEVDPDKNYSGVIARTITQIPPGSGYFTHASSITGASPLSASQYNNGIPLFALSGEPFSIVSYRLQPERFCSDTIDIFFDCNVRDGFSFISPNGSLLVDSSSDDPTFDPITSPVYYDILADGGVNPSGPDYRANFAFAGIYTFTPPPSAITNYYGYYFVVSSFTDQFTPCNDEYYDPSNFVLNSRFFNIVLPNRDTAYVPTLTGLDEKQTIYKTKFVNYGDFYFRNSNSSIIQPVSSALSGIFLKYPSSILNEINTKIVNFDIYYDTLQIETQNYLVFDKIEFNYTDNDVRTSSNNETYVTRGNLNQDIEKFSTVWFNENNNELILAKTILHPTLSASNFKAIYPVIYALNLNTFNLVQIYPEMRVADIQYSEVIDFTLSGTGLNIDIVTVEKPILRFNTETSTYSITYLGKDTSNMFYIFNTDFKYFNGILANVINTMYTPTIETLHTNFSNPSSYQQFNTYSVAGSSTGNTGGNFIFA